MDESTNKNYLGWPDRLYLVDTEDRLASGRGPFSFFSSEMNEAINIVLAR